MNPPYINQPGGIYGMPPTQVPGHAAGMQPMPQGQTIPTRPMVPQQNMYNGMPASSAQGPVSGASGVPMKAGIPSASSTMMPPTAMQNGPQMSFPPSAQPQGDQFQRGGVAANYPPMSMGNMMPPAPPSQQQMVRGPPQNNAQLSNQMGAMNISGVPPRPGVPTGGHGMQAPPSLMSGMPPRPGPPGSSMSGMPPRPGPPGSSMTGMPPRPGPPGMSMPAMGQPSGYAPPTSNPPSSMPPTSNFQQNQPGVPMSGPMGSLPGQGSMMPPHVGMGMPTASVPPFSTGQAPPSSSPGMTGPLPGQPLPHQAHSMGTAPQMPPPSAGGPPSSMAGQYGAPPGSMSGMPPPSPGYSVPQQPGFGPASGPTGPPGTVQQQPQQQRRLDPDQMPSPVESQSWSIGSPNSMANGSWIQVIEDNKINQSGAFQTGSRANVPPLVTTPFVAEDQGNCNPRFIRSTMYNIPCTSDMIKQSHIPFALDITPFARLDPQERQPPLVDLGQLGPVRCNRCKAYMCPYMQFIEVGRRFQCSFCGCNTEVPPEYFAHLDHHGRRTDYYDRPELCLGAYEFVATPDYCRNNQLPNPPAFIFMIDVSYNSVKSGLVHLLCSRFKEDILQNLPREFGADESEIRVGFVTYAKELHFYNIKGSLAQPQMLVVSDVQDVFVPLLDGFLVKLSESEAVIDSLLAQIPQMFAESRETEIVLGPVIQAGMDALKSADCAGKLFIFHSSLPIAEAPGKLKNRDDRKLLGTDKEKTLLTAQSNFYTKLGQECVSAACGVDMYLFPNAYIDVATIAEVPRLTGGGVHKYMYFQADLDGHRLMEDLKNNVMKPIAFDGIMRIRTSQGIRPVDFFGNFYMSNTTDVEIAVMDCDKSVNVEIKHDDKLSEAEGAHLQAALLYTSVSGQRRLRVLNMAFNSCSQMTDLFRNCELDVLINHMAKVAIRQTLNNNPKHVRETVMNQCAQILACYRRNCASPSSAGQLILPECMKLLPVYSNCIIKSNMLQGGSSVPVTPEHKGAADIATDDRSLLIHLVNAMSVRESCVFFYPRLFPLHNLDADSEGFPSLIRCSYDRLKDNGVYLIENSLQMFIWIGINVAPSFIQDVFGVQSAAQIDIDMTSLQEIDTPLSRRIREIVKDIRQERNKHLKLTIVRQRDKLEPLFQQYLVEDRGASGTASYVDFLCHIHKEIRGLLS